MRTVKLAGNCRNGPCPAIWQVGDEISIQGEKETDPEVLADMNLPEHETAMKLLTDHFNAHHGA